MTKIVVDHISKEIKGNLVLNDITITFMEGNVYGLYGRNGSGKTMLFRSIAGLIKSNSGSIYIDDKKLEPCVEVPENLGILIENPGFYPNLTGYENLELLASINNKITKEDILEVLKYVGLYQAMNKKYKEYSLGMKQRLGIAQAIMEHPKILILDEPTNGLDEDGIEMLRNVVLDLKKQGVLIILASHNKDDLRILCDKIYKIEHGSLTGEISL